MQQDAVIGQQLDVLDDEALAEETYKLKTASYTVQGPLRLGALLAGAENVQLAALDDIAVRVGVAFQLRDDLLSLFGDPKQTGKPRGSDLTSGKRTLLVELAERHGSAAQKRALAAALGKRSASKRAIEAGIAAIEASSARARVETRIVDLTEQAATRIEQAPLTSLGRAILSGALITLTQRRN
jgi:geranylgeranyl diphosphate synthase type I